jgi:hypothetical protein
MKDFGGCKASMQDCMTDNTGGIIGIGPEATHCMTGGIRVSTTRFGLSLPEGGNLVKGKVYCTYQC